MKITNKDKKLLSTLACVLILVVFVWYLILPANERIQEKKNEIEMAEIEKQEMDMKISMFPEYDAQIEQLRQRTADATRNYYDRMSSQEVDRELTGIVLEHSLECVSLSIQPLIYADESPYTRSAMARLEAEQESGQSDEVQDQVFACKVSMTVEGGTEDCQRLVDLFVNDSPSIRVTAMSYQDGQARTTVQQDGSMVREAGSRQLVLNLNIYMCDKSLYSQPQEDMDMDVADTLSDMFQSLVDGGTDGEAQSENQTEGGE